MFTVFANMRISSDERLRHMKESFESFKDEPDDWLINVRGSKRDEALTFLRERLGDGARFFDLLDDSRGWMTNALEILPHAKHDYVLFWVEDHINISPRGYLQKVVEDMRAQNIDNLVYSWWNVDLHPDDMSKMKEILQVKNAGNIEWSIIDAEKWRKVRELEKPPYSAYLISLISIFRKDFLIKLLQRDRKKLPRSWTPFVYRVLTLLQRLGLKFVQREWFDKIDRMFFYKFQLFPKETPFDLEKRPHRFDILPLRTAYPLQELFVCIDDDLVPEPHGYSLISRGIYPLTDRLSRWNPEEGIPQHKKKEVNMQKEDKFKERYVFYGKKGIRITPVKEYLRVISGKVRVSADDTSFTLSEGEGAAYYTNIPHEIVALEDSTIERYMPDTGLAPYYFSA